MRVVAHECPKCGAHLQVDADAPESRCTYCDASFLVVGDGPPPATPRRARSRKPALLAAAISVVVLGLVAAWLAASEPAPRGNLGEASVAPAVVVSVESSGVAEAPAAPAGAPTWLPPPQAIPVDTDGDGDRELVGWVRYYQQSGTPQHLAALDGALGGILWQSTAFPAEGWGAIRVALAGDRIVVADAGGLVQGIAVASGKTLWSTPIGERARRICGHDPDSVRLWLEDGRIVDVALASGLPTPRGSVTSAPPCPMLWSTEVGETPDYVFDPPPFDAPGRALVEGVEVTHVLRPRGQPTAYALGVRTPGTAVPSVAAFRPDVPPEEDVPFAPLWRVAVPATAPLEAATRAPDVAAFASGRLFVAYQGAGGAPRLVALDGRNGENLFDVPLPELDGSVPNSLVVTNGRVYVSHMRGLDAYDVVSGVFVRRISP